MPLQTAKQTTPVGSGSSGPTQLVNLRESLKPLITAAMHWEIELGDPKIDSEEGDFDTWQFTYVFSRDKDKKFTIQMMPIPPK